MAAVTKAKKLYTSRKSSLVRLLDPIPQLTQDGTASMDRLIEHRKECKIVWEQFVLAREELVQVRPEDEDPDAVEFGTLEIRKTELMGTLAEVIGSLNAERLNQDKRAKDEQAQQDRDAELEQTTKTQAEPSRCSPPTSRQPPCAS